MYLYVTIHVIIVIEHTINIYFATIFNNKFVMFLFSLLIKIKRINIANAITVVLDFGNICINIANTKPKM